MGIYFESLIWNGGRLVQNLSKIWTFFVQILNGICLPFSIWPTFKHLNAQHVCYSDPHCTEFLWITYFFISSNETNLTWNCCWNIVIKITEILMIKMYNWRNSSLTFLMIYQLMWYKFYNILKHSISVSIKIFSPQLKNTNGIKIYKI